MSNPLTAAGAIQEPSEYATLSMDRQITGLYTQRSPLRDADVPYLYVKFYSASRFDSLIDGLNRELNSRLDDARRFGSSAWNSNTFPKVNSFFSYKYINYGIEVIKILVDGQDGNVYDATGGGKLTLLSKSAGAGKMRYCAVGTELFFADGVDLRKGLFYGGWQASTNIAPGTMIVVGTEPVARLQMALGGISLPIVAFSSDGTNVTLYVNPAQVPDNFPNLLGASITFSGFSVATYLNGTTRQIHTIVSSTLGIFQLALAETTAAYTVESGMGTTGTGTTGSSSPTFSTTQFGITTEGGQQWKCYGVNIQNWGLQTPVAAPILTPQNGSRFWQPTTVLSQYYAILDNNGNIQYEFARLGTLTTGRIYPKFVGLNASAAAVTSDGTCQWVNLGAPASWAPSTAYASYATTAGSAPSVILDSNNNLQFADTPGSSGAGSHPTWATSIGSTTTDGSVRWICLGPGIVISTASWSWAYSMHAVDGSVSTASPAATIVGGILGPSIGLTNLVQITSIDTTDQDSQIDQLWIWRTAQGQSTLVFEDAVPLENNPFVNYYEIGIPDTSIAGGGALIPQIIAPIAESNNPPQVGMTAPVFHCGCVFGILNNTIVRSGGGGTLTGNGYTAFAPLAFTPITDQPIRLYSGVTNQGNTLFIFASGNVWAIYGDGTENNPFTPASKYMANVGILNYDAMDVVGSTFYLFTSKNKLVSLDPSAGYVEQGFPIGDQFVKVTTGGISSALYSPSTAFVSWCEINSEDTGIYVSDGAVGWFRFSPISSPETGYIWSPRAAIVGGTSAVQSVETSSGIEQLLIGPGGSGGPILFRDSTVNADWNAGAYQSFESYDTRGNIVMCQSGEVAEIAHIALKSIAVGARPVVSLLWGEIAATTAVPFEQLAITSTDPPNLPPSQTMYSDRYSALQGGETPKGDNFQLKIDYGVQNFPDELLMFSVYGAKHAERRQQ